MNAQEIAKAARFSVGDHVRLSPSTVMWSVTHCSLDENGGITYDLRAYDLRLYRIPEERLVFAGRSTPLHLSRNPRRGKNASA
jgi:hypothetical protein